MLLSILMPTTFKNYEVFEPLFEELSLQALEHRTIEILALIDNTDTKLGAKRNNLLKIAKGDYILFVDEEDWISNAFLSLIVTALNSNENIDVVFFHERVYREEFITSESILKPQYNHVWKRSLVQNRPFPIDVENETLDWPGLDGLSAYLIAKEIYYRCKNGCRKKYFNDT